MEGWLSAAQRVTLDAGRSVDMALDVENIGRCRFNLYRAGGRYAAAIRLLPRLAPALEELRMPIPLDDLVAVPHGLVIVCGPTGSGKSTTLAALARAALAFSARRGQARMLISLEDPIEFTIHANEGGLVRQRQVGSDVLDFPTGLRDALREDPDVLLIGEMRDAETISLAMTAAETGHLVLTSLHSRSAIGSIERIVDTYPAARQQQIRVQLAESPLRGRRAALDSLSAQGTGRAGGRGACARRSRSPTSFAKARSCRSRPRCKPVARTGWSRSSVASRTSFARATSIAAMPSSRPMTSTRL